MATVVMTGSISTFFLADKPDADWPMKLAVIKRG
jgi:hypothetical protein